MRTGTPTANIYHQFHQKKVSLSMLGLRSAMALFSGSSRLQYPHLSLQRRINDLQTPRSYLVPAFPLAFPPRYPPCFLTSSKIPMTIRLSSWLHRSDWSLPSLMHLATSL